MDQILPGGPGVQEIKKLIASGGPSNPVGGKATGQIAMTQGGRQINKMNYN